MPSTVNGASNSKQLLSPEQTISQLDDKIASTQAKLRQLKLQVLNEEKKLEKFLNERRIIESALSSSSFKFTSQDEIENNGHNYDGMASTIDGRPGPLRRLSSGPFAQTESPRSPPPTTQLSPPPFKNRLHAGHTPMHTGALSPSVSNMATPLAAPKAPAAAELAPYSSTHRLAPVHHDHHYDLPDVEDDPKLEGPLTAHDAGFLDTVTEKLEKVMSEEQEEQSSANEPASTVDPQHPLDSSTSPSSAHAEEEHEANSHTPKVLKLQTLLQDEHMLHNGHNHRANVERDAYQEPEDNDGISPLMEKVPVIEMMEGVKLKAKRSTNFGVPLGRLR